MWKMNDGKAATRHVEVRGSIPRWAGHFSDGIFHKIIQLFIKPHNTNNHDNLLFNCEQTDIVLLFTQDQ